MSKLAEKLASAQTLSRTGASKSLDGESQASAPAPLTLTPKQEAFCIAYLETGNATEAYRKTYSVKTKNEASNHRTAKELIDNPKIASRIAELRKPAIEAAQVSAEATLREAWAIMTADPREFVDYRVGCCRHCWGKDFRYQRTAGEFERYEADYTARCEKAIADGAPVPGEFDPQGGIGYDKRLDPNPECPECFGEGVGRTVFKDTSKVSKAAASLFAGIKETKDGLEVKLHSKDSAMDKMFRHMGLYNDKIELTMPTVRVKDFTGKA